MISHVDARGKGHQALRGKGTYALHGVRDDHRLSPGRIGVNRAGVDEGIMLNAAGYVTECMHDVYGRPPPAAE